MLTNLFADSSKQEVQVKEAGSGANMPAEAVHTTNMRLGMNVCQPSASGRRRLHHGMTTQQHSCSLTTQAFPPR